MPDTCPDCDGCTETGARCAACEAVEAAFTPGGSRAVEPRRQTISFPILVPTNEGPSGRRIGPWIAAVLGALALAAYAVSASAG